MNLKQTNEYVNKLLTTEWVMWIHDGSIPANSNSEKILNTISGTLFNHCARCLNLNGCCFVKNKCPEIPVHQNCHCYTVEIDGINPTTTSAIEKFTKYLFNSDKQNTKTKLFELWGYSVLDSEFLKNELEKQAKLAYMSGNYELGKLDIFGQRITIKISLKDKLKDKIVEFNSGWMMYPDGKIVLTTPYGGKYSERI